MYLIGGRLNQASCTCKHTQQDHCLGSAEEQKNARGGSFAVIGLTDDPHGSPSNHNCNASLMAGALGKRIVTNNHEVVMDKCWIYSDYWATFPQP